MGGNLIRTIVPLCLLAACVSVQAQQMPAGLGDSNPVKLGWMLGGPPPDGSFYQSPRSRWAFSNMRSLDPTTTVSRGDGSPGKLSEHLRVASRVDGQTIHVDPAVAMVIVRLASRPSSANANIDHIRLPAYRAIADRLSGQ